MTQNKAASVSTDVDTHTVRYYHATATLSKPVENDPGWHRQWHYVCKHNHETSEAAEQCSVRLRGALLHDHLPTWARQR